MITLKISFLLRLNTNVESPPIMKINQKSRKSKKRLKTLKKEESDTITVGTPIDYVHIDYELPISKLKFWVDIVFWGPVAKIYTTKSVRILKTVVDGNTAWVSVTLEHSINSLSNEEIGQLESRDFFLKIKTGKSSIGPKAKKDKITRFYSNLEEEIPFQELFPQKPTILNKHEQIQQEIQKIIDQILSFPDKNLVETHLHICDFSHKATILGIIEKRVKLQNIRSVTAFKFKISAAALLSNTTLSTYHLVGAEKSSKLLEVFALISCKNCLELKQKLELNPLVVKINKISNFPVNWVKNLDQIFVHCHIPGLREFKTDFKPLGKTINFDETQVIFGNNHPQIKILEILQGQRVYLKIFGTKSQKEHTLLCVCSFDLSPLSMCHFLFKEKGQCYHSRSISTNKLPSNGTDGITVNEINLNVFNPTSDSIIPQNLLLEMGTTLEFEAFFAVPQNPMFYIHNIKKMYRRMLLIVFSPNVAVDLLKELLLHNPLPCLTTGNDLTNLVTGVVIDDGNSYIFIIEGLSNGVILNIIHKIRHFNLSKAKVFYNSENLFEEQIYKSLIIINLSMPLKDILAKQEIYLVGNIPTPCHKALQKLDLIMKSSTLHSILSQDVLLTNTEALSLALKFGKQPQ